MVMLVVLPFPKNPHGRSLEPDNFFGRLPDSLMIDNAIRDDVRPCLSPNLRGSVQLCRFVSTSITVRIAHVEVQLPDEAMPPKRGSSLLLLASLCLTFHHFSKISSPNQISTAAPENVS